MAAFEIGRICVKTAGRETAMKAVVLGFVDKNFVLVTGAGVSGVRRRKANLKHLIPIDQKVDITENAADDAVSKALDSAGIKDNFAEEFKFGIS